MGTNEVKELSGIYSVKVNEETIFTAEQIEQIIKEAKIIYWKEDNQRLY